MVGAADGGAGVGVRDSGVGDAVLYRDLRGGGYFDSVCLFSILMVVKKRAPAALGRRQDKTVRPTETLFSFDLCVRGRMPIVMIAW
jgi:hypothetical protein